MVMVGVDSSSRRAQQLNWNGLVW